MNPELQGSLSSMPSADLLQWIQSGTKTGLLKVVCGAKITKANFENGQLINANSSEPLHHLGQFLLSHTAMEEEDLLMALDKRHQTQSPIGTILVDEGLITTNELKEALAFQAEECIYDLFLWDVGDFSFMSTQPPDSKDVVVRLDTTAMILEGVYRKDEWNRINDKFPNLDEYYPKIKINTILTIMPLQHSIADPLRWATGENTIPKIAQKIRRPVYETARLFLELVDQDLIKVIFKETKEEGADINRSIPAEEIQSFIELLEMGKPTVVLHALKQKMNPPKPIVEQEATEMVPTDPSLHDQFLLRKPKLLMDLSEVVKMNIEKDAGFIISRINGNMTIAQLAKITPFDTPKVLELLIGLKKLKVVSLES